MVQVLFQTKIGPLLSLMQMALLLLGCRALRDVHCKRQTPPTVLGSSTNGGAIEYLTNSEVYLDATLYVPQGSLSAYKAKNGWKEFGKITEE